MQMHTQRDSGVIPRNTHKTPKPPLRGVLWDLSEQMCGEELLVNHAMSVMSEDVISRGESVVAVVGTRPNPSRQEVFGKRIDKCAWENVEAPDSSVWG